MADTSKAVKTLRRFYKDRLHIPDSAELEAELTGTNDRAAIIIVAAFIDDALETKLMLRLRRQNQADTEQSFRPDGPLGPFSYRIELAYLLELIDLPTRERINDVRELRNACAHARRPIAFKNPEVANVAKRVIRDGRFPLQDDTPKAIRAAFIAECIYLFTTLIQGPERAEKGMLAAFEKAGKPPPLPRKPTAQ